MVALQCRFAKRPMFHLDTLSCCEIWRRQRCRKVKSQESPELALIDVNIPLKKALGSSHASHPVDKQTS